ncbi:MAG: PH domain-containing protein, partial [Jatrophihabitans sp.]
LCMTAVVRSPLQTLVYLVPAAAALYIARTATVVDEQGLHARAVFGSQRVGWDELRGLRLDARGAVYAVDLAGTQLRLPCVRSTRLDPLIAAGAGRLPQLPQPPAG